jgi:ABC-2 type transport system permease protein
VRAITRYLRLYAALARYGLARELAFRGNFVVKVSVELLWLCILIAFYRVVFTKTPVVANWSEAEYLFFVGCYYTLSGLIETFFLANCSEFAELVRTGDLDFYLLMPIDEQFLITCRDIDWSSAVNLLTGTGVMSVALWLMGWVFSPVRLGVFLALCACGTVIAYSLLLLLTSTSVWLKRNQSLYELWWLFTSLMRYPREIFAGGWATPVGWFFSFVIPVLLVVNVPAAFLVKLIVEPKTVAFTVLVAGVLLFASRSFFRFSLTRYRSASS